MKMLMMIEIDGCACFFFFHKYEKYHSWNLFHICTISMWILWLLESYFYLPIYYTFAHETMVYPITNIILQCFFFSPNYALQSLQISHHFRMLSHSYVVLILNSIPFFLLSTICISQAKRSVITIITIRTIIVIGASIANHI